MQNRETEPAGVTRSRTNHIEFFVRHLAIRKTQRKLPRIRQPSPTGLPDGVPSVRRVARLADSKRHFDLNLFLLNQFYTSSTAYAVPLPLKGKAVYHYAFCGVGNFIKFLIIGCVDFEVCLRMRTSRTNFGSLFAGYQVTAVTAFPNFGFCFLEYFFGFHIL